MFILKRVLESIVLGLCSSSFVVSLVTLLLILARVRPLTTDPTILLTCNTYVTVIGSSFMTLLVMIYAVKDALYSNGNDDDHYTCQLRSYVNYVFICSFYYSCALQAAFRLFRVVFSKHRLLRSRRMLALAILAQWIVPVFYILAYLIEGDFEFHADMNSCWLSFKDIRSLSIAMAFVYGTPLILMGLIYAAIIRYVRRTVQVQQARLHANKRDVLIVKRIIILVLIAMGIGIPTAFLLIIYMATGQLTPLAYHIQAISLTVGLVVESVALGVITPQVRQLFKARRQHNLGLAIATLTARAVHVKAEQP